MKAICRALGASRSNYYDRVKKQTPAARQRKKDDANILVRILKIISEKATYGYRRITAMLRRDRELPAVNHKRVYRVMKDNNLLFRKHASRPTRVHDGKIATSKSNLRWCSDAFRIQCDNGEHVEVVFAIDCHDREVMSWACSTRGIDGSTVRDLMVDCIGARFGSELPHRVQWLSDNGPCYVARQTVSFARHLGFEVCTTRPYSPESNGMAEAFVKTFKRDYAYLGNLSSAESVMQQLPHWFEDYNNNAPHKALGMMSPRMYMQFQRAV